MSTSEPASATRVAVSQRANAAVTKAAPTTRTSSPLAAIVRRVSTFRG